MNFDVVAKGAPRAEAASYPGCQTLPARNRADMPALANVGLAFSRQQHYQEAADCYRKALSIEPKLRAFQLNLGLAEFKLGDFKAALGPLGAVLAIDPQNLQARTLLGVSYYGAGMYARFPSWTARWPPIPTTHTCVIAQSCLWSGQHERALQEFEWLLREQPDSAATHMLMGEALDGLGRAADAIVEFQAAATASPTEPQVQFGLSYLFWKERRYDEAEGEFHRELAKIRRMRELALTSRRRAPAPQRCGRRAAPAGKGLPPGSKDSHCLQFLSRAS
jgi:tetratricopeptide (TPR) repeat protein